jgi:hypothetical protein
MSGPSIILSVFALVIEGLEEMPQLAGQSGLDARATRHGEEDHVAEDLGHHGINN